MAKLTLYGDINCWNQNNAVSFIRDLTNAASGEEQIDLHVHCYGGSVLEGNMICNAIKSCKVPVYVYVDGIAASMAAIIAMYAKKVYMSENAFLMIHAPAGNSPGRGTAAEHIKTAKMLRSIEKTAVKVIAAKTSKTDQEVNAWMEGDNWFSAEEALSEKLIDGIVGPAVSEVKVEKEQAKNLGESGIYDLFKASLVIENQQNQNQMDKKSLIARLELTGVNENSSDAEIEAAIEAAIEAKLNAEKQAKEAAEKKWNDACRAEIKAALDGIASKITPEQRTALEEIGEKMGLEVLQTAIAPYTRPATFSEMIKKESAGIGIDGTRAGWDWDKWEKEDARALEAMAKEEPERFNTLYRKKFDVEAPRD